MATICRLARVRGRVQGVAFRAHTRERALQLGVVGQARNLADGSVEVLACGDEAAVRALCDWLRQGPPRARVDAVEEQAFALPPALPDDFATG
ncbi:acylphosphatase [Plasticicumulans lactativorans]|uniref:acylphosphatase n=1 Tax=Plasticicumulans lactativorans TaxID=1133106 RepID=A0A4R2L3W3_9GAMM|nr:acylphosphatase [Plasticicumulans lactativorans]TCO81093.1 acylphosphatase [Plasticicumulans lactativorans]